MQRHLKICRYFVAAAAATWGQQKQASRAFTSQHKYNQLIIVFKQLVHRPVFCTALFGCDLPNGRSWTSSRAPKQWWWCSRCWARRTGPPQRCQHLTKEYFLEGKDFDASGPPQQVARESHLTHYCHSPPPTTSRHFRILAFLWRLAKPSCRYRSRRLCWQNVRWTLCSKPRGRKQKMFLLQRERLRYSFPVSQNSSITFTSPAALAFIVYAVSIKYVVGCCGKTILQYCVVEFPRRLLFKRLVVWGQQTKLSLKKGFHIWKDLEVAEEIGKSDIFGLLILSADEGIIN